MIENYEDFLKLDNVELSANQLVVVDGKERFVAGTVTPGGFNWTEQGNSFRRQWKKGPGGRLKREDAAEDAVVVSETVTPPADQS